MRLIDGCLEMYVIMQNKNSYFKNCITLYLCEFNSMSNIIITLFENVVFILNIIICIVII